MSLADGGHLTHGASVNFSGKLYKAVQYGINVETGEVDYDEVARLAQEHQPKMIVAGFSAYSRRLDWQKFRDIADSVGAYFLVDMAHVAGLVAAGEYPNPLPFADVVTSTTHKTLCGPRGGIILARSNPDIEKAGRHFSWPRRSRDARDCSQGGGFQPRARVNDYRAERWLRSALAKGLMDRGYSIVSGGTDNHLFLLDLVDKDITGKAADAALGAAILTVNKNAVPNDPRSPFVTSGIRIGSPAVTRDFKEAECLQLAGWIADILDDIENEETNKAVQAKS